MKPLNELKVGDYTMTSDKDKPWTIMVGEGCFVSSNDFSDINVLSKTIKNKGLNKDMKDYLVARQIDMMKNTEAFKKSMGELRDGLSKL